MKRIIIHFLTLFIVFCLLFSTNLKIGQAATVYPYSVQVGDKIDYHVDVLTNGSSVGPINVLGLDLKQGDNFQLEIFKGVAQSNNYVGSDYLVKFIKGSNESIAFSGSSLLFTSNSTFWDTYKNASQDIGGQIYQLTRTGTLITYSWTQDADNLNKISFNTTDGLVTSFERKASSGYNYTDFKFTKGAQNSLPGFDIEESIVSLFSIVAILMVLKRKKNY